jgi:predicted negative regulator of RcsB-dependent stress response
MSQEHMTEDEQVEALKRWWRENGKSTLLTIAIAVAAVFGWQGWQKQQQASVEAASALYQNMLTAALANNAQPNSEQLATANHLAETLKTDFANSTYADFAALYQAKFAVEAGDLAAAEQALNWVLAGGSTAEVEAQARLRLARVQYAAQNFEQALATLNNGEALGYASAFEELKGDIYQSQGKTDLAAAAYEQALALAAQAEQPINNPLLTMKAEQVRVN